MARRLFLVIAFLAIVWSAAGGVRAQQSPAPPDAPQASVAPSDAPPPSYDTPPAITVVDGTARLSRQGQAQAAVANMPLIEGDRLTTENGRVAITFPDGSLLHLDRNTTLDFLSLNLMRLLDGRVILVAAGRGGERPALDYQVDAPAGSVRVQAAGEYRVSTSAGEVELDVVTGNAALATDQGSVDVEAGERSFARDGGAPGDPQAFNSARLDAFDQWSEGQREADVGTQSAQYLPSELDAYAGTFDQNGRWDNVEGYGNVWYPTVSAGWRPYYNGYWDYVGPYGWTWIGSDRWAWPTHHFGRWGFRAGSWFWVPERHWGPAWVSWGFSPGFLSWCPLDFYNRPIVSLFFESGFRGHRGFFDPWLAWTVVPRHQFGRGVRVANFAVSGGRLAESARNEFVVRRSGPEAPFAAGRRTVQGVGGSARATARALPSVTMQSRPRDSAFASSFTAGASGRAMPRSLSGGGPTSVSPRRDSRSLSFSTGPGASQRNDRPGVAGRRDLASPGTMPRGSVRSMSPYENRPPSSYSRSQSSAQPRSYQSSPSPSSRAPGAFAPRDMPSARPRGDMYSSPRSGAPQMAPGRPRGETYSAPRSYSAPPTRGNAYAAPRYSAPASPRYSAPSPRYSAPPAYFAPRSYSAPRSMSPGSSAPSRSGGGSAPSSRPAPSGSNRGGGGRGRPRSE